jgi:hypothetical protein
LAILRAVQVPQTRVQPGAPPFPSLAKLCLAECGSGSLDVLDEAALVFAGNK